MYGTSFGEIEPPAACGQGSVTLCVEGGIVRVCVCAREGESESESERESARARERERERESRQT